MYDLSMRISYEKKNIYITFNGEKRIDLCECILFIHTYVHINTYIHAHTHTILHSFIAFTIEKETRLQECVNEFFNQLCSERKDLALSNVVCNISE